LYRREAALRISEEAPLKIGAVDAALQIAMIVTNGLNAKTVPIVATGESF
jgi:hypothetical protein